jgi:serine/threonine protein kinase
MYIFSGKYKLNPRIMSTGGDYVAEGTYGCVFSPAEPCTGEAASTIPHNQVSKVFRDIREAKSEEKEAKAVQALDPTMEFTLPFYQRCTLDIGKTKPKGWGKCKHSKHKETTFPQLRYENGGLDLDHLFKQNASITIEDILPAFMSVIKGLIILGREKKVHQDIKPANLLYSDVTKRVYLIDFGLSMKFRDIYTTQTKHIQEYDYPYYPPEYKLYYYLLFNMNRKKDLYDFETFFNGNFRGQTRLTHYLNSDRKRTDDFQALYRTGRLILDDAKNNYQKHKNRALMYEQVGESFRKFASKIDVYSLGISILSVIGRAEAKGRVKDFKALAHHIFPVLFGMTRVDVSKRMTPEEAYRAYKTALTKMGLYRPTPVHVAPPKIPATSHASKKTKTCQPDEVLNPETNRCVKKTGKVGKKILEEAMKQNKRKHTAPALPKKVCAPDEVLNPATNRCVKKTGKVGKKLISEPPAPTTPAVALPKKVCAPDEVLNPATNRCVKKTGKVGKKVVAAAQ